MAAAIIEFGNLFTLSGEETVDEIELGLFPSAIKKAAMESPQLFVGENRA